MQTVLEGKAPQAIVAKAEAKCEAVSRLAKQISAQYEAAKDARVKSNSCGLEIGRAIISACFDQEVVAQVTVLNSKANKPLGGTATKVYSWMSEQLADNGGYSADYLRKCAKEYLDGYNALIAQGNLAYRTFKKLEINKAGVFGSLPAPGGTTLPDVKEVMGGIDISYSQCPEMETIFGERTPHETPTPEKLGIELADKFIFKAKLETSFNPVLVKAFVTRVSPYLEKNGYAIMRAGKKGGSYK